MKYLRTLVSFSYWDLQFDAKIWVVILEEEEEEEENLF